MGSLRTSMATCGYEDIPAFHRAEVMVAPALQTEGKQLQREQAIGMGATAAAVPHPAANGVHGDPVAARVTRRSPARSCPRGHARGGPPERAACRTDEVLVLDFGGQYSQLIARRVRECGVFSELLPHHVPLEEIERRARGA